MALHNVFADRLVANTEYLPSLEKFRRENFKSIFFLASRYIQGSRESILLKLMNRTNEGIVWLRILWGDDLIAINSIDTRESTGIEERA